MARENFFSCCFTGYRPQKLPFPVDPGNREYIAFENALMDTVFELANNGCRTFYSGMAIGFDIIAAECVLTVKKTPRFREAATPSFFLSIKRIRLSESAHFRQRSPESSVEPSLISRISISAKV